MLFASSADTISEKGILFCCVCHEQNTTYRYEVVYKGPQIRSSALHSISHSPIRVSSHSPSLYPHQSLSTEDPQYYNFPVRHPRHGHLKWPVLPLPSVSSEFSSSYPDYPIHIPTTSIQRLSSLKGKGSISGDLRTYLNTRFPKGGVDHELQNTIRDNLYLRTVPVTTRPARPGEKHGIDYTFLSKEEFLTLEKSGELLESGIYEGHHYGTPKPPVDSSRNDVLAPGPHPSSEGKRKRNRSNVEAMTCKHQESLEHLGQTDSGHPDSPEISEDPLGPLPPQWEKAYTDKGEPYFIDHKSGTSHWLDPRLSRIQKKRPEDCSEDELPFGWERIDDPHYGTYYIDHVNRRTQYENPVLAAKAVHQSTATLLGETVPPIPPGPPGPGNRSKKSPSPFFTRDPQQLRGERITTKLVKSSRGLGFTIVGGDDSIEEFLQIKSVVPNGPAWIDNCLETGDVLVYVNKTAVLGYTHYDMVSMFQSIPTGSVVELEVCRGYPLPFDPDDPNTEIVTTVAVTSPEQGEWAVELEQLHRNITLQPDVQSMPDLSSKSLSSAYIRRPGSADLLSSYDYFDAVNDVAGISITKGGMGFGFTIADSEHGQKVKKILDRSRCKNLNEGDVLLAINSINVRHMSHSDVVQVLKDCPRGSEALITIQRGLSSSPTKSKYRRDGNGAKASKTGLLFRSKTPTADATQEKEKVPVRPKTPLVDTRHMGLRSKTPTHSFQEFTRHDFSRASLGGTTQFVPSTTNLSERLSEVKLNRSGSPGRELDYDYGYHRSPESNKCNTNGSLTRGGGGGRKESTSFEHSEPLPGNLTRWPRAERRPSELMEITVTLHRQDSGFGFRIVGGTEEGSQVSIGHIVPRGSADLDGRLFSGDEIVAVDQKSVLNSSHHQVVSLMSEAGQSGRVTLTVRRRIYQQDSYGRSHESTYPYDVSVERRENEGFGFVIISSISRSGSTIGRIIPGSPAGRIGRLHVGDRILAVNHVDINYMHHGEIVNLIKDSGFSVVLTVGPPIDDSSSTTSNSIRGSTSSMVTAQAMPTVLPPTDSTGSTISAASNQQQQIDHHRSMIASYNYSNYPQPIQRHHPFVNQTLSQETYDPYNMASHDNNYHQDPEEELNMLELDDQYFAVELTRGSRGFGFSIRGGREFQSMPLFVLRIAPEGPAAIDGRLRVRDQIIEINGNNTKDMTHTEAIELIKSGGNTARLLVRRGETPEYRKYPISEPIKNTAPHHRPISSMSSSQVYTNGNGGGGGGGNIHLPNYESYNYLPNGHHHHHHLHGPVSQSSPREQHSSSWQRR